MPSTLKKYTGLSGKPLRHFFSRRTSATRTNRTPNRNNRRGMSANRAPIQNTRLSANRTPNRSAIRNTRRGMSANREPIRTTRMSAIQTNPLVNPRGVEETQESESPRYSPITNSWLFGPSIPKNRAQGNGRISSRYIPVNENEPKEPNDDNKWLFEPASQGANRLEENLEHLGNGLKQIISQMPQSEGVVVEKIVTDELSSFGKQISKINVNNQLPQELLFLTDEAKKRSDDISRLVSELTINMMEEVPNLIKKHPNRHSKTYGNNMFNPVTYSLPQTKKLNDFTEKTMASAHSRLGHSTKRLISQARNTYVEPFEKNLKRILEIQQESNDLLVTMDGIKDRKESANVLVKIEDLKNELKELVHECKETWVSLKNISKTLHRSGMYNVGHHTVRIPLHIINLISATTIIALVGGVVLVTGFVQSQVLLPPERGENRGTPLIDAGAKVGNFLYGIFSFNTKASTAYNRVTNILQRSRQKI